MQFFAQRVYWVFAIWMPLFCCVVRGSALIISCVASEVQPAEGQVITLTVSLQNDGYHPLTGIVVQEVLSPGLSLVLSSATQGQFTGATGIWDIGDLDINQTVTLVLTVFVQLGTAGSSLSSEAFVMNVYGLDELYPGAEFAREIISPFALLQPIAHGFASQSGDEVNEDVGFVAGQTGYLVVGGSLFEGASLRGYILDPYWPMFVDVPGGVQGFDVQPTSVVRGLSAIQARDAYNALVTYIAAGGPGSDDDVMHLYQFSADQGLFTLIPNAFDVQPASPVEVVKSFESADPYTGRSRLYIIAGGDLYNGVSAQVYRIDSSYDTTCTRLTSGVSGFDVQFAGNVYIMAVLTVGSSVYLAMGGAGFFGAMTRLYWFDPALECFIEQPGISGAQPSTETQALAWFQSDDTIYLVSSNDSGIGDLLRLYELDVGTNTLTLLSNRFDQQPIALADEVLILLVNDQVFLVCVGKQSENKTTHAYVFDSVNAAFLSVVLPNDTQAGDWLRTIESFQLPGSSRNYVIAAGLPDGTGVAQTLFVSPWP